MPFCSYGKRVYEAKYGAVKKMILKGKKLY